jgi:hypothetical protein
MRSNHNRNVREDNRGFPLDIYSSAVALGKLSVEKHAASSPEKVINVASRAIKKENERRYEANLPPLPMPGDAKRLKRGSEGQAIISRDAAGAYRYMYDDHSLDMLSKVDARAPNLAVVIVDNMVITELENDASAVHARRIEMLHKATAANDTAAAHHLGLINPLAA